MLESLDIDIKVYTNRLKRLQRHVSHVWEAATILADRLIELDVEQRGFSQTLLANAHIHDASKFHGIEWIYLHDDVKESNPIHFQLAFQQHVTTNQHHPEYWSGGVGGMPEIYIAEMVCDWKARSSEFGSSLRDWVEKEATKKYHFTLHEYSYVGKSIMKYMDMILDKPFTKVGN